MSLSSTSNRNDYTGNGSVSTYSYTFPIVVNSDLLLVVADAATPANLSTLVIGTDYTVAGAGSSSGGSISLVSSGQSWLTGGHLTTGFRLIILRIRPINQTTDIRNQGSYFPEVIEDEFDDLAMIDQQQAEQISRSLSLPVNLKPSDFNPVFPTEISTPDATIKINSSGDGFEIVPPPTSTPGIYGTPTQEIPSGSVNGSNAAFTLAHPPISNASVTVYLDRFILVQGVDYSISGTAITMTTAPFLGQGLYAVYQY